MHAIFCFGVHPDYADMNKTIDPDDYIKWTIEKQFDAPKAFCRDEGQANLIALEINRAGCHSVSVDVDVPDDFKTWGFLNGLDPEDIQKITSTVTPIPAKTEDEEVPEAWKKSVERFNNREEACEPWGYYKYLSQLEGRKDRTDFDTPEEAYDFGQKLRANIKAECYEDKITVSISTTVVRARIIE